MIAFPMGEIHVTISEIKNDDIQYADVMNIN